MVLSQTDFTPNVANGTEAIVPDKPDSKHAPAAMKKLINNDSLRASMARASYERTQQSQWGNYQNLLRNMLDAVFRRHAVA